MALKLNEKYPGYMNAPSVDYPQGSFKNRTSPTSEDGSYFEQDWANDIQGFTQSLIQSAGVTPNGNVDKVGSSQYFDALKQVIKNESPTPSQATDSVAGVAKIATQTKVNTGTDDLDFVTSKKLRFGVSYLLSDNGYIFMPSWLGGFGIQWGVAPAGTVPQTIPFPTSFPNAALIVVPQCQYNNAGSFAGSQVFVSAKTKSNFTLATNNIGSIWIAFGN